MNGIRFKSASISLLLLLAAWSASHAIDLPSPSVRLLSDHEELVPGQTAALVLAIDLQPGWHTYWVNPGDAGMPIKVEWDIPDGWQIGTLQWPTPKTFDTDGFMSYGYEGTVYLLADLTVPPAAPSGTAVQLKARIQWLICKDVCIPRSAEAALVLPIDNSRDKPEPASPEVQKARRALPGDGARWFCHAFYTGDYIELHGKAPYSIDAAEAYFFPETPLLIDASAGQEWEVEGNMFRLRMQRGDLHDLPSEISGVLLVGKDGIAINARISEKSE